MARKKKSQEALINFPPNIHQLALDFCKERMQTERAELESRLKQERDEKARRILRLKLGLGYAERIFGWAEAFRKHELGRELIKKSHLPTACHGVFFFDGHIEGVDSWVGMGVNQEGIFLDRGGKMSAAFRKIVKSASELAIAVDQKILREVCLWIDNGKAWDCIERRFDYLNK